MHVLHSPLLFILLLPLASSFPVPLHKRALTFRPYNSMSISSTPAGTAAAEATTIWTAGLDLSDLTAISAADLAILSVERENAEDAETAAFNPAVAAASGEAAVRLQCGKIKNKVLKLTGLSQIRRIQLAQAQAAGEDTGDIETKLADSEKKLATNIAIVGSALARVCGNESRVLMLTGNDGGGGGRIRRVLGRSVRRWTLWGRQVFSAGGGAGGGSSGDVMVVEEEEVVVVVKGGSGASDVWCCWLVGSSDAL